MIEEWKDIPGYEGLYQVSSLGNIKSINYNHTKKEKLLKPQKQSNGYMTTRIGNKTKTIHRIVANAFITNSLNKPCINHIDGNKTNNRADNLEWCTNSENMKHAIRNGMINYKTTKKKKSDLINIQKAISHNKRKIQQFNKNGDFIKEFNSVIEASKETNSNATHISRCAKGFQKLCGGFVWKYKEG